VDFNINRYLELLPNSYFIDATNQTAWRGGFAGNYTLLGLALSETVARHSSFGSWGGNQALAPNTANPWSYRGSQAPDTSSVGIFTFNHNTGLAAVHHTFRPILAGI
jgi:hypothetical protein